MKNDRTPWRPRPKLVDGIALALSGLDPEVQQNCITSVFKTILELPPEERFWFLDAAIEDPAELEERFVALGEAIWVRTKQIEMMKASRA
jgi:hypothetical protein